VNSKAQTETLKVRKANHIYCVEGIVIYLKV